jgi:hypothetical protein
MGMKGLDKRFEQQVQSVNARIIGAIAWSAAIRDSGSACLPNSPLAGMPGMTFQFN